MHRIDTAGNVGGLFVPPNPVVGQPPVIVDSAWLNDLQENVVGAILAAGISLVKGDYTQLTAAIRALTPTIYAADTGAANAMAVTLSPAPGALTAGLSVRIKVAHTNTGAVTLAVNGLAATAVTFDGVALTAGALTAGDVFDVCYDGTGFELLTLPTPSDMLSNGYLAKMAPGTVKANLTGAAAAPSDVSVSSLLGALGFTVSATANGYIQFPAALGGIVLQWGQASVGPISGGFGNGSVVFPLTFPNACWVALPVAENNDAGGGPTSAGNNYNAISYGRSVNGFSIRLDNEQGVSTGSSLAVGWVAIGN